MTKPETADPRESVERHARRNFSLLAAYHIVMRMGWIFKTESIIMPAVLDALGGTGWQRGCLPMLNRFGQSIPPWLFSARVRGAPRKKWLLFGCTFLFALTFLALASMFRLTFVTLPWQRLYFLLLYAVFFVALGINQLTFHTLQGKLIRANRRGRLMLASNVLGACAAILCVWLLMPRWLSADAKRFDLLFGFAGMCFGVSALFALLLREPPEGFPRQKLSLPQRLRELGRPWREDKNFRRLALIAATFGTSFMLFPHYQALARERMGLNIQNVAMWVIVQNAGTGLFSLIAGPVADLSGNRRVLKILLLGICLAPAIALGLSCAGRWGQAFYSLVFVLVGMTPVALRTLNNYTLEIASREDQPSYLGALAVCVALPNYLSPLLGLVLDQIGYEPVFCAVCGLLLLGWWLTFGLREPRRHLPSDAVSSPLSADS